MKTIVLQSFLILILNLHSLNSSSQENLIISNLMASSGKTYEINRLLSNEFQYMDRDYRFDYVPDELINCIHIKTHGNDKLVSEEDTCFTFTANCAVDVYLLFADKFPEIPKWMNHFERTRLNVTRKDSNASNLKGYFGVFKKSFEAGKIALNGCSTEKMLNKEGYIDSMGSGYCMYTVAVKKNDR